MTWKAHPHSPYDKTITIRGPGTLVLSLDNDDVDPDEVAEALPRIVAALNDATTEYRADRVIVLEADNGWKRQIEASEALPNFTETVTGLGHVSELTITVLAADDVYA